MADIVRGMSSAFCNDRCGRPSPCPGGIACRCTSGGGDDSNMEEHRQSSCGEHCVGCNPCTCSKTTVLPVAATGKPFCQCGGGCTRVKCAAA